MSLNITKEMIERELGYEINKFTLDPIYNKKGECTGLSVNVEPKVKVEFIDIKMKIVSEG